LEDWPVVAVVVAVERVEVYVEVPRVAVEVEAHVHPQLDLPLESALAFEVQTEYQVTES
jgi:hypothetical protein